MTETIGTTTDKSLRRKATKVLPTDRIRFDKQLDILRAYATASGYDRQPTTTASVAPLVEMAESTIAQANAFFVDVGFLVRQGGAYIPAAEVSAYAKATEWDKVTAPRKLQPIVANTWFAQLILPKVKFRPVNEREAIHDLDELANAGPDRETQLRLLIEFMVAVGLVDRDGNLLKASAAAAELAQPQITTPLPATNETTATLAKNTSSNIAEHQLWLIEILNTYDDLPAELETGLLELIRFIKGKKVGRG